jgi:hypothetical protein
MFTPEVHLLSDPWAEHPVVNRHIMNGGGGGGGGFNMPMLDMPDYSKYITAMTDVGNKLAGYGGDIYEWAKKTGVDLTALAKSVSDKASSAADTQQATGDRLMGDWETMYKPLYQAQAADAQRMIGELPRTEEQYAGKFGADTAIALDQAKATEQRKLQAQGLTRPGVASQALDTSAAIQRSAATTAAAEQGRLAARTEARNVTNTALESGKFIPGVAATQQGQATGNRNQALNAPLAAASTTAGLYSPATSMYNSAFPYLQQWGATMGKNFEQGMAQRQQASREWQMNQENDDGGIMGALLPIAGGIAGSFLGPMGTAAGSAVGKAAGSALTKAASGGAIRGRRVAYAKGGAIDTGAPVTGEGNLVPPEASPSGGQVIDDVPAMVSEGEFVIPKRTVDWYGDKFFQNLIAKGDKEQDAQTVAEPEMAEPGQGPPAIDMMPPMFRSEGARA